MSPSTEALRQRLFHRSRYMGIRELDMVFGRLASTCLPQMTEVEMVAYGRLLDEDDRILYDCVMGKAAFPSWCPASLVASLNACAHLALDFLP